MIEVYRTEVSTNGRTSIIEVDSNTITLNSKEELEALRKKYIKEYCIKHDMDDLVVYFSYKEKE